MHPITVDLEVRSRIADRHAAAAAARCGQPRRRQRARQRAGRALIRLGTRLTGAAPQAAPAPRLAGWPGV